MFGYNRNESGRPSTRGKSKHQRTADSNVTLLLATMNTHLLATPWFGVRSSPASQDRHPPSSPPSPTLSATSSTSTSSSRSSFVGLSPPSPLHRGIKGH